MFMSLYLDQLVLTCTEDELVELTLEAELQRRYDLVPNLVATVKASAAREEKVLARGSRRWEHAAASN